MERMLLGLLLLAQACAAPGPVRQPVTIQVVIDQFAFDKPRVSATVGDTIEWINKDIVDHTSTEKKSSLWNVTLAPGKSAKTLLETADAFDYFCKFHPNMTGQLVVDNAD